MDKIDVNSAAATQLTQLPGVAINLARAIVTHRQRHGFFTSVEELCEVKDFPADRLDEIRERVVLGNLEGAGPPRHFETSHLEREKKRPHRRAA